MQIARAAEAALLDLDTERSTMYSDMLFKALSEAASRALRAMNPSKYEYQTEFAKRYYGQGLTEGEIRGRTEVLLRQLRSRFGALPTSAQSRIHEASIEELDRIAERLLTAATLADVIETP